MRNRSKSLGILSIGFLFCIGGCNSADAGGDTTQSVDLGPSDEVQDAVVIAEPHVPGNLQIIVHDTGNSCAYPYGNGTDFTTHKRFSILLPPALQAIGTYSLCEISSWHLQYCTDGPQCTGIGTIDGKGDAKLEITSINGSELQFTITDLQNCTYPYGFDPNSSSIMDGSFNGTYTAPRCD